MHILWLSCAWASGNYGPIPAFQSGFLMKSKRCDNFFTLSPPAIPASRSWFLFFYSFRRDITLGFFSSLFFFSSSSRISILTVLLFFSALLPGRFFNLSRKRLEIFLVFKILLLVRKKVFGLSFFFFLNIYLSSRVIFSKHPQNFSQLFENLHSSVHTPLPRFFNPPLSTPSASLLHFLTSNFLPDNSLK